MAIREQQSSTAAQPTTNTAANTTANTTRDDRPIIVLPRSTVLDTPSGNTLRKLVEAGIKLGISSRGVGSTKKDGDRHVVQG